VLDYDDLGTLTKVTTTNRFGDKSTIEYRSDGRFKKNTDSEGNVRAFLFDELGRLKQIQDDNSALMTKEYGQTNKGWMESVETPAVKTQTLFDKSMRPLEHTILSKVRKGEAIVLQNSYNKTGNLTRQVTEGLIQQERTFNNQGLLKQTLGGITSSYSYDDNGRIREAKSDNHSVQFTYGQDDFVQQVSVKQGDATLSYEFTDEGLVKRTTTDGLQDSFTYDSEGRLAGLKRSDGEAWVIDRSEQTVSTHRNDVLQTEFVFDEEGRLAEMFH